MILKKMDNENAKPGHLVSKKVLANLESELETWNKIENIYWLENSREIFSKNMIDVLDIFMWLLLIEKGII